MQSISDRDGWFWLDGEWLAWRDARMHLLTHTLHYGMGCFEGVRAYDGPNGVHLFRADAHVRVEGVEGGHDGLEALGRLFGRVMFVELALGGLHLSRSGGLLGLPFAWLL